MVQMEELQLAQEVLLTEAQGVLLAAELQAVLEVLDGQVLFLEVMAPAGLFLVVVVVEQVLIAPLTELVAQVQQVKLKLIMG